MDSIDNATFNYSVSQGDLAGAQGALNQSNLRNGAGAGFPANSAATPGLQQQAVNQQVSALTGGVDNGTWDQGGSGSGGGSSGGGGGSSSGSSGGTTAGSPAAATATPADVSDARVRLGALSPGYYTGILAPLQATGGVLFPYTPQISFQQDVDYTQVGMVHTDMDYYAYQRTPSVSITVQGKFTVQNAMQGVYALAAIHFFRAASKMYFGASVPKMAGLPPPVLVFNGYGTYMFNKLTCILKSHSFSFSETMDTVAVAVNGKTTRLPAMFDITCTLTVQQTFAAMRDKFNLDTFRSGALMAGGGWI